LTGGLISATSTITSASNITGANVLTGGLISATGNVTGSIITATGTFMVMPVGASDPATTIAGAFYFNTGNSTIRIYTGSGWVSR
jgi:flagellar hook protein FlgE